MPTPSCLMSDLKRIERLYFDGIRETLVALVNMIHLGLRQRSVQVIELLERCKREMDSIIAECSENQKDFVRNRLTIELRDVIVFDVKQLNWIRNELYTLVEQTFHRLFGFELIFEGRPQHPVWDTNVPVGPPPRTTDDSDDDDPSTANHTSGPGTKVYNSSGIPGGGTRTEFSDMYTVLNNLHMRLSALESIKVNLLRN